MLLLLMLHVNSIATETRSDSYGIKIRGKFKTVFKDQNSYKTPFDHPEYGYDLKSGASHRSDQPVRGTGEIDFYFGDLGKSEWFGGAQILLDANDPDTETGEYNESFVELGDLVLMYRPVEMKGGRPFGITAGIQTIPSTMNGFTTYLFKGDVDLDFPANLVSGLINVPAITFDFHVDENTGIGFTYARGCSHISEVGTFMHKDSAKTLAFWARGKWRNIILSGAYQNVEGHRGSTETVETDNGNTYSEFGDDGFKHHLFNSTVACTFNIDQFMITPFVGYQTLKGDETPLPDYANEESTIQGFDYVPYGPREVKGELKTLGLKIKSELFGRTNIFCIEYTDAGMDDFNGIDGLKKGAVDRYIQPAVDFLFPDNNWSETSISGFSSTVNKFSDIDYVLNAEYCISLNKSVKAGIFFFKLKAVNDPTINNETFITGQISERLKNKLMAENGFSEAAADMTIDLVLLYLNTPQNMNGVTLSPIQDLLSDTKAAEWTDTQSIGFFFEYSF
ncbi:MAG: hypothetical protein KJ737_00145 [Proteobacteria bacterium]|nr:hypothetical protein [Pseudomonadota bacterium]